MTIPKLKSETKRLEIRILVFVFALGIIGFLTVVNKGNMTLSETCRYFMIKLYEMAGKDPSDLWWNDVAQFRKIGHVVEYFVLGVSARSLFRKIPLAVMVCASVSILDQLTKVFIPMRHFDASDLPFDIVGYMSAILVVSVIDFSIRLIKNIDLRT